MSANCRSALVSCAAFCSLLSAHQAAGATDFLQTYIDAQGGCRSGGALTFVLTGADRQAPFGKPAADWTDDDLISLKRTLATCIATSAARENPYLLDETRQDADRILANVPRIVEAARSQREAQVRQLEARKQLAKGRLDKAGRDRERARASAEAEVARLEREASLAEADARRAVAAAKRQIDDAVRKSADVKAGVAENLASLRAASPPAVKPKDLSPPGDLQELQTDVTLAKTKSSFVACKAAEQLAEASKGIVANDMSLVGKLVKDGQCFVIDQGTSVRLRDTETKVPQGPVCVRVDGHASCLWLPSELLQKSN